MRGPRWLGFLLLAVALAGCGVAVPRYRYEEEQLGRRTWQVRADDWWPGASSDLERFVLYRAAERTRELGLRYFVVRETSGDAARFRFFMVGGGDAQRPPYPAVTDGSELGAAVDRMDFLYRTPYSELTKRWQHLKFRMLRDAEIGEHFDVVDGQKVLEHLRPFIDRRR